MDFNTLVNEIVARVAERMGECRVEHKPSLLILTAQHSERCHAMLENPRLRAYYQIDCALMNDYDVCVENYEAVILYGLTVDVLTRLAGGVCDTPFTALAQQAILMGKKIFVCEDEVTLFRYEQSAPPAYYQMLSDKLAVLTASGVVICPAGTLADVILSGAPAPVSAPAQVCAPAPVSAPAQVCAPEPVSAPAQESVPVSVPCAPPAAACSSTVATASEARIEKKIITEKDIAAICDRGTTIVHVTHKAILTELARDFAHSRKVNIIRDG